MSEPTDPHGEPAPPSANPPKRPGTILGRIARALREQNWAAVAVELVIVVLGVVIGFQVTAWGQARADAAREQSHLRQLAADLRETQALLDDGDARAVRPDAATRRLYDAFYAPERPPRDSLLRWVYQASWIWPVRPVLGTAEALVSTGDLALVRDDSLRSAITAYLDDARRLVVVHDGNVARWVDHSDRLMTRTDRSALVSALDPAQIEALRDSPTWALLGGPRRDPVPFSPEALLTDRESYAALLGMADMKQNLGAIRGMLRTRTDALLTQVEAELDR